MKHLLILIILSIMTLQWANAQVVLKNDVQIEGYKYIPQERMFAHVNTSLLLTGEYLYYTVYCFNAKTESLSDLSKIAYVELISEKGEQVFKQKIKLKNGLGNGDFFIPVSTQTGSYKLLAYTNWMQNIGVEHFFQADIHIINPYQAQKNSKQATLAKAIDSAKIIRENIEDHSNGKTKVSPLGLLLSNDILETRSKISLTLKGNNENKLMHGNYSISVRKKGNLPEPSKHTIVRSFIDLKENKSGSSSSNGTTVYVPELRGELLSGVVSTSTNNTIKNLDIATSIPGEDFYIDFAKTNDDGQFYINIDKDYEGDRIFLEILDKPHEDYDIVLKELSNSNFTGLHFKPLLLDSLMKPAIIERSIHNQIDNAYFKYKPDSIISTVSAKLFDTKEKQVYKLDDFTRFKTVRETIFEIVKDVSISNRNKTSSILRVQGYNEGTNSGVLPLVLIDGLQITNHTMLLDRNAFTVDQIEVYRDRFVLGSKLYQGALLFTTKNKNIEEFENDAALFSFNLLKPQVSKNYFTQRYDVNTTSRIPDDRLQLLWIPNLKITSKVTTLDFFTSDVTGTFEICIEGFTSQQEPISIRRHFSVKK